MIIGEYCRREVVIAERGTSLRQAAKLMRHHHVGDLVVVDRKEAGPVPAGILTDRDLVVEVIAEDVDLDEVAVGDVMTTEVAVARQDEGIWDTLFRMRSWGVRRLPVVDDAGILQGIITIDDLLELFTEHLYDLVQVITREREREIQRRA